MTSLTGIEKRRYGTLRINLICGRHLIAADRNGFSDPYCVFFLSDKSNKKQKSKVLKKTLEPVWNESFYFTVSDPTACTLELKVLDKDLLGSDNLGNATIPLTGLRKGVEKGLTVMLKDVEHGEIDLTLNPLDFDSDVMEKTEPAGKLRVTVLGCRNLIPKDMGGKSDPFVTIHVKDKGRPQRTTVQKKTLDPSWTNEVFDFDIEDPKGDILKFTVYDFDRWTRNDFLGSAKLPVIAASRSSPAAPYEEWLPQIPLTTPTPVLDKGAKTIDQSRKERGDIHVSCVWYGNPHSKVRSTSERSAGSLSPRESHSSIDSAPPLRPHWEVNYAELQIGEEIGKGAFGVVYKAKWRMQEVAVKRLVKQSLSQAEMKEFREEASLMMALRPHKNLIQLLGVCIDPNKPLAIITTFVEGGNLQQLLKSDAPLSWALITHLCMGAGMYHLHEESILHRDLAARNVLLQVAPGHTAANLWYHPLLADFGLSKHIDDLGLDRSPRSAAAAAASAPGSLKDGATTSFRGPFKYMAPESLRSLMAPVIEFSVKTDIWSFGVLIWELLTRSSPFPDLGLFQAAHGIAHEGLRLSIPDSVPQPWQELMLACWRNEPEERPTFTLVNEMLENISKLNA